MLKETIVVSEVFNTTANDFDLLSVMMVRRTGWERVGGACDMQNDRHD